MRKKDADYYFEKLKDKGLNKEKYYSQALSPTRKYEVFPNEKIKKNKMMKITRTNISICLQK